MFFSLLWLAGQLPGANSVLQIFILLPMRQWAASYRTEQMGISWPISRLQSPPLAQGSELTLLIYFRTLPVEMEFKGFYFQVLRLDLMHTHTFSFRTRESSGLGNFRLPIAPFSLQTLTSLASPTSAAMPHPGHRSAIHGDLRVL